MSAINRKESMDHRKYACELKRLRQSGIPKPLAKQAAREAATPVKTPPELTNPAGLDWFEKQARKRR